MKQSYLLLVILCIFGAILVGCSRNSSDPVIPSENSELPGISDTLETSSSRTLLGVYDLTFDGSSQDIKAVPVRDLDFHMNVSSYLFPPSCADCVQYEVVHYFPKSKKANVSIKVKNPTTLAAYDVRGIVYSTNSNTFPLIQPDGYTSLYDIPGGNGYGINPFVAFGKETADRRLAGLASQTAMFRFYFPGMWTVRIAFDASYPSHCDEPYYIGDFYLEYPLQSSENYESNARVFVKDWQNDVTSINLVAPQITTDMPGFYKVSSWWRVDLMNDLDAEPGIYKALIRATSNGQHLYQYVDIEVSRYATVGSILQTCKKTEYFDNELRATDIVADNDFVYYSGYGDEYTQESLEFRKLNPGDCSYAQESTYYTYPPNVFGMDQDYLYGFGHYYYVIQKDFLGVIQNYSIHDYVYTIVQEGDSVWAATGGDTNHSVKLVQYDISNPLQIKTAWSVSMRDDWYPIDIAKKGKYLYVVTHDSTSTTDKRSMVSIYSAENGELFDSYESDSNFDFTSVAVLGDFIYLGLKCDDPSTINFSFLVLNVSDLPWDIEFSTTAGDRLYYGQRTELKIFNDTLYVAMTSGYPQASMATISIWDLNNIWAPSLLKSSYILPVPDDGYFSDFVVNGDYIYVLLGEGGTSSKMSLVKYTVDWVD